MMNILYVDDEENNLDLFEFMFSREFRIFRSLSADHGLKVLKDETINLVITDLRMPEMDGIEFIRTIKRHFPHVNCILLTGYYEPELANDPEVKQMVYRYVMKPFKKEEMKSLMLAAAR
jgi:DNA-binding NtrC family response regulator